MFSESTSPPPSPAASIPNPVHSDPGVVAQVVTGDMVFAANEKHSYNIVLTLRIEGTDISSTQRINLQDQMYHYLTSPASAGQV